MFLYAVDHDMTNPEELQIAIAIGLTYCLTNPEKCKKYIGRNEWARNAAYVVITSVPDGLLLGGVGGEPIEGGATEHQERSKVLMRVLQRRRFRISVA